MIREHYLLSFHLTCSISPVEGSQVEKSLTRWRWRGNQWRSDVALTAQKQIPDYSRMNSDDPDHQIIFFHFFSLSVREPLPTKTPRGVVEEERQRERERNHRPSGLQPP